MADFFVPEIDPKNPQRHLRVLQTEFGVRSVYDSVSFCNRCGSCQQVCPTYALTGEEPFSPRGRNQAVRLAAEGKLKIAANRARLEQLVNTCLLCGRCTQACAGKIPTAQHMLELRRALKNTVLPGLLQKLLGWRSRRPGLFRAVVRAGLCLRRMGLLRLLRGCGLTRLAALQWLEHADDILPRRINSSDKTFWRQALQESPKEPSLIYLPSLEAAFFMPSLAARVLKKAQQKYQVQVWEQVSSGLFEYVYGDLRQSRRLVRRLIRRCARTGTGSLPLLTDSIDVYLFWRRAPQLFDRWPRLARQAQAWADRLVFVTELFPKTAPAATAVAAPVRLDPSALFEREGKPFDQARQILKTHFKKNFVECFYRDADTPAFGYAFVRGNLSEQIFLNAVRTVARTQTGTVFTLSGLSALELNYQLRRFYPQAQADHLACLDG